MFEYLCLIWNDESMHCECVSNDLSDNRLYHAHAVQWLPSDPVHCSVVHDVHLISIGQVDF